MKDEWGDIAEGMNALTNDVFGQLSHLELEAVVENTHAVPNGPGWNVLAHHLQFGFCHRCTINANRYRAGLPFFHDKWWLSHRHYSALLRAEPEAVKDV